jgi:probable HAF family extracellular repeat protein
VLTDLGTLGGNFGGAHWINDAREIVGFASTAGEQTIDGFLWKNGVMTDLGTVNGEPCSAAQGINSKGQIVGGSFDCMVEGGYAWLWEGGSITDLNTFVPPGSSLQQLVVAFNINDSGEIDGLGVPPGVDPADVFTLGHVFALIPCDNQHDDGEGCEEGRATHTTRRIPAQVTQNPTATTTQPSLPSERMNAIRARLARRYPYRGFWAYQSK